VDLLLEWCASLLGVTSQSRLGQLVAVSFALFAIGLVLFLRWGPAGWAMVAMILALIATAARRVTAARDALWRATRLALDDPRQRPPPAAVSPPSAVTLGRLAKAVDALRRDQPELAEDFLYSVDRRRLRPDEVQLLEAARIATTLGIGEVKSAVQQAVGALPSGCDDLDARLGRAVVGDAWEDPARLRTIAEAWARAGVDRAEEGTLARLYWLMQMRLGAAPPAHLGAEGTRALSSEARAIGDEDFAAELEADAHGVAYR
jgi:hypothetical protein